MAKEKTKRRRAVERALPVTTAAAAGFAVGRYSDRIINMLPHGFESFADGTGKGPTENKRVLILGGATLYLATTKNKSHRRWAPFSAFLLGASIRQHKLTYEDSFEPTDLPIEVYEDEMAEQAKSIGTRVTEALTK